MNTLKPLLIVAVLAGIGYGVYVRLNRGANAPPPRVAEGWETGPAVQLPGQPSPAPWGPPAALGSGASAPQTTQPTGSAPPFPPQAGARASRRRD